MALESYRHVSIGAATLPGDDIVSHRYTTPITTRKALLLLAGLLALQLVACRTAQTSRGGWRLEKDGLAVEMAPALDRYTYFGPVKGPNLIHINKKRVMRDAPNPDGSYTFFGGVYTWASPQADWFNESGELQDWPPDPAMDTGPVRRGAGSRGMFEVVGPVHRRGLREIKRFTIVDESTAELTYSLENASPAPVRAGTWTNASVRRGQYLAICVPPGTKIWGTNENYMEYYNTIVSDPDPETGWAIVRPWKARWKGGIKIYMAPLAGEPIKIAIRYKKRWFYRSIPPMSEEEIRSLLHAGEGPIALYIQPGRGKHEETIIEAELYGPLVTLEPGDVTTTTELWRIFKSKGRSTKMLPAKTLPPPEPSPF